MNQATKEAVATIAELPVKEREQVLAMARTAGRVFDHLVIRRSFPTAECKAYNGKKGEAGGKPALQEILTLMGAEFSGGTGGRGNSKVISLKKL